MRRLRAVGLLFALMLTLCGSSYRAAANTLPPHEPLWRGCPIFLPRSAFPTGTTEWHRVLTKANVGAARSGFQQAHYSWGYILLTFDVYTRAGAAWRHYLQLTRRMHDQQPVHLPGLPPAAAMGWVAQDGVVGDIVTTVAFHARTTVYTAYIGAQGPAVATSIRLIGAANHACR